VCFGSSTTSKDRVFTESYKASNLDLCSLKNYVAYFRCPTHNFTSDYLCDCINFITVFHNDFCNFSRVSSTHFIWFQYFRLHFYMKKKMLNFLIAPRSFGYFDSNFRRWLGLLLMESTCIVSVIIIPIMNVSSVALRARKIAIDIDFKKDSIHPKY